MGEVRVEQEALFYEFNLERHVPPDHLLRAMDRFVDLAYRWQPCPSLQTGRAWTSLNKFGHD
jgi:hypothetical protein